MRNFIFLSYLLLLLSLLSCAAKETPSTRAELLSKGFVLLDERKYDEAISYFADLAAQDPHYQVKLAWASAYAARAGIKIEVIYAFVTARPAGSGQELSLQGLAFDQQTRTLLQSLEGYTAIWEKIPEVSPTASQDLQNALRVLSGESVPGVRLYSATLRAVLLKTAVTAGLRSWSLVPRQKICVRDVKPYWNWGLRVLENLLQFSRDLESAFPSKAELREASLKLQSLQAQAQRTPLPEEGQCF